MEKISHRQKLTKIVSRGVGIIVLSGFLNHTDAILSTAPQEIPIQETTIFQKTETISSQEVITTVASIFGLHDTPIIGGSINEQLAMDDARRLGAKFWVSLNPNEEMLKAIKENQNLTLITRAYMENNQFDEKYLTEMMHKLREYIEKPLVVPYNETNLTFETGGTPVSARNHIIKDFIPAAELILKYEGIPILTPTAQSHNPDPSEGIDGIEYFKLMIDTLIEVKPELLDQIKIGVHDYTKNPGEDIWKHPEEIYDIVTAKTGKKIDMYITEAGLYQSTEKQFDEQTVVLEETKTLKTKIPEGLPVMAYCDWAYSGFVQRPEEDKYAPNLKELQNFETMVKRGENGETAVYKAIENFKN